MKKGLRHLALASEQSIKVSKTIIPPITAPRVLLNKSSTSNTPLCQISWESSMVRETNNPTSRTFANLYLSMSSPAKAPMGMKPTILRIRSLYPSGPGSRTPLNKSSLIEHLSEDSRRSTANEKKTAIYVISISKIICFLLISMMVSTNAPYTPFLSQRLHLFPFI